MKEDIAQDTKTALYLEEQRKLVEQADLSRVKGDFDASGQSAELRPYLDGQIYDRVRVMEEIKFYMNQTVEGIIETGRRFIVLREKEKGHFCKYVDELGVSRMTAWRFMAIAKKISNVSRVRHLNLLDMKKGIGKLYAFLDIPDDELKEFEESGELRGLTIDEIDAMPVKELKERLRKKEKQIEQGVLQLQGATGKIETLEKEIEDLKTPKVYTSEEEKYIDVIKDLGNSFEVMLLNIKAKIGYDRVEVPQNVLKKLFYLLLYIQKETLDERLRLQPFYEGADDIPWEPVEMELPDPMELRQELPHMEPILKKMKEKAEQSKKK
jgi:hypothetical protein